jgi:hypothetical protein
VVSVGNIQVEHQLVLSRGSWLRYDDDLKGSSEGGIVHYPIGVRRVNTMRNPIQFEDEVKDERDEERNGEEGEIAEVEEAEERYQGRKTERDY